MPPLMEKKVIHNRYDAIPLDVQIKLCLCIIISFFFYVQFTLESMRIY